jgi:6-phosphogluconolactonase (cycloisomerase 2 family)
MRRNLALITFSILLASCGGGGSGGNPPATYTVSATVAGLQPGAMLVLLNNGTNSTPVSANGTIGFSTPISSGGSYSVTVATQPTGASCTVANGSGTVGNANINVAVTCTLNAYTIGGTVSGLLAGDSIALQNNNGNDMTVVANGGFTFSSTILSGSVYAVTVLTQPTGQNCIVTNGSGTVVGTNVSNVVINCSVLSYTVGITVSGPPTVAGLIVQNNGSDNLSVPTGGTYSFPTPIASGSPYAVTILTQPAGYTCFVTNGSGTVRGNNVNVAVTCPWHIAYVANEGTGAAQVAIGNVSAYYIDATTGALTPVAGSPVTAGIGPADIKIDPTGHFVYVVNFYSANISAYAIDSTSGALTEVAGSPFASGGGSLVIVPIGPFAYVAGGVFGYSINTATGALTGIAGSPFTALGGSPPRPGAGTTITADPSGEFAYIGLPGDLTDADQVIAASVNSSTGALTPAGAFSNGGNDSSPTSIAVASTGKFVYVTDHQAARPVGFVRGYTRDGTTGALTPLVGSPFASGNDPSYFAIGPDGKFAYVPDANDIWVYSIDGTSGALTPIVGSPFPASSGGDSATIGGTTIAIDPSGAFACAVRDANVSVYRINGTSGALTAVTGSPFAVGTIPIAIAIK